MTSVSGENISMIGGGNPGNSPPQVEGEFSVRETVEVSLFPAESPKKVILSVKNAENLEHLREKLKTGKVGGLREKHSTY